MSEIDANQYALVLRRLRFAEEYEFPRVLVRAARRSARKRRALEDLLGRFQREQRRHASAYREARADGDAIAASALSRAMSDEERHFRRIVEVLKDETRDDG